MANRKQYYGLDDVGFLGVADKRSVTDIKADAKKTSDYFKRLNHESSVTNRAPLRRPKASKGKLEVSVSKKRTSVVKAK